MIPFKYMAMCLLAIAVSVSWSPARAELAFAGAGSSQCDVVNANTVPGRGAEQNVTTQMIFSWVQGYMSGFNGYSLMVNQRSPFDLGAVSTEAQWEFIVSYCRSHPAELIVKAIQDLELKLLAKRR